MLRTSCLLLAGLVVGCSGQSRISDAGSSDAREDAGARVARDASPEPLDASTGDTPDASAQGNPDASPPPLDASSAPRDAGPVEPGPEAVSAFYIGHSLQSDVPDLVGALAEGTSDLGFEFKEQFIPGAPLAYQLQAIRDRNVDFEPTFRGYFDQEFGTGDFDTVVMIESVPRGPGGIDDTHRDALTFAQMARGTDPGARLFFYEPWHCTSTGTPQGCNFDEHSPTRNLTWRDRVAADAQMWRSVVTHVNDALPQNAPRMRLIPGATALSALLGEMEAGTVPGFTRMEDIFLDDIHLNPRGTYFMALVHFATLFHRLPDDLPGDPGNRWGSPYFGQPFRDGVTYQAPSVEARQRMAEIAWQVVSNEPLSGVR